MDVAPAGQRLFVDGIRILHVKVQRMGIRRPRGILGQGCRRPSSAWNRRCVLRRAARRQIQQPGTSPPRRRPASRTQGAPDHPPRSCTASRCESPGNRIYGRICAPLSVSSSLEAAVHLVDRHLFFYRGHAPRKSERIGKLPLAVSIELIGNRAIDSFAPADRARFAKASTSGT